MLNLPKWNTSLSVLGVLFVCLQFGLWSACQPTPSDQEPPTEKKTVAEKATETISDGATAEPLPERSQPPESKTPEPTPEPKPKDEPPPVPPKILINGIPVIIVHVIDGDTIYVVKSPGGWASIIRLKGMDSPECFKTTAGSKFSECNKSNDYFGLEAYVLAKKLALGDFRKGKVVCLEKNNECEKDPFGRYLAYIELPDGRDLAKEVVRGGGGFTYTSFSATKLGEFCRAEADAIREKKGMWSKGRAYIKSRMSNKTKSWYYKKKNGHDSICSKEMKESFAKRAGE